MHIKLLNKNNIKKIFANIIIISLFLSTNLSSLLANSISDSLKESINDNTEQIYKYIETEKNDTNISYNEKSDEIIINNEHYSLYESEEEETYNIKKIIYNENFELDNEELEINEEIIEPLINDNTYLDEPEFDEKETELYINDNYTNEEEPEYDDENNEIEYFDNDLKDDDLIDKESITSKDEILDDKKIDNIDYEIIEKNEEKY